MEKHPGYGFIAMALATHLRTVRAQELTMDVWKISITSLVKAEQLHKTHIVAKIKDLLRVVIRETQNVKPLQEHLNDFGAGRTSAAVSQIGVILKEASEANAQAAAADESKEDDIPMLAIAEQSQRTVSPELAQTVDLVFAGGMSYDELLKRMSDAGAVESASVSCLVRAAVNATVKEGRAPIRSLGVLSVLLPFGWSM
jgi:hypothetical protein